MTFERDAADSSSSYTKSIVLAVTIAFGLGAAVAAAPMSVFNAQAAKAEAGRHGASAKARPLASPITDGQAAGETKAPKANSTPGVRQMASGPSIKVARLYEGDDEDCVVAVVNDASGAVHMRHSVLCN